MGQDHVLGHKKKIYVLIYHDTKVPTGCFIQHLELFPPFKSTQSCVRSTYTTAENLEHKLHNRFSPWCFFIECSS